MTNLPTVPVQPTMAPTLSNWKRFLLGFLPISIPHLFIPVVSILMAIGVMKSDYYGGWGFAFLGYFMLVVPSLLVVSIILAVIAFTRKRKWLGYGLLSSNLIPFALILWVLTGVYR